MCSDDAGFPAQDTGGASREGGSARAARRSPARRGPVPVGGRSGGLLTYRGIPQTGKHIKRTEARFLTMGRGKGGKPEWTLWCWTGVTDAGVNSWVAVSIDRHRNKYGCEYVCLYQYASEYTYFLAPSAERAWKQ